MTDSIPLEGWRVARLGDVFSCWGGMTPSTSERRYWGGEVPWISSKDVRASRITAGTEFVTRQALQENRLRICRPGTVLVVVRSGVLAHTLPVGIADTSLVINQDLKALDSGDDGLNEWLALYLRSHAREILDANRKDGTTVQSIRVEQLLDREISIPPRAEQRRIAANVEALLAQVSAANKRLACVPQTLKQLRQSILAAACEGMLTARWRSKSSGSSSHSGDPSDRTRTTVGEISSLVTSGSRGWARYYSDNGPVFIRSQDINTDRLLLAGVAHVRPPAGSEGARTRAQQDDLLITITGANVTKTAVICDPIPEAYVSQHVALVRLKDPGLSRWLHLWLLSQAHGRRQLLDFAYGAGKPGLNLDNVRNVALELPPEQERNEIVRRVQALLSLADSLERRVNAAQSGAERLPQALLSRAFAGELVPNEADLARAEGRSYETATELLERILVERHTVGVKRRVRTRAAKRPGRAGTRSPAKSK